MPPKKVPGLDEYAVGKRGGVLKKSSTGKYYYPKPAHSSILTQQLQAKAKHEYNKEVHPPGNHNTRHRVKREEPDEVKELHKHTPALAAVNLGKR
jgi:hypothetical protein